MDNERIIKDYVELTKGYFMLKGIAPSKAEFQRLISSHIEWNIAVILIEKLLIQSGNSISRNDMLKFLKESFQFESNLLCRLSQKFLIQEGFVQPTIKAATKSMNEFLSKGGISMDENETNFNISKIFEFLANNPKGFKGKPISARKVIKKMKKPS